MTKFQVGDLVCVSPEADAPYLDKGLVYRITEPCPIAFEEEDPCWMIRDVKEDSVSVHSAATVLTLLQRPS